jgi:DNA repair ATPase RecN
LELQIQLRKGGMPQIETIEVIDETKVKELEKRAAELRELLRKSDAEIEELSEQIRQLQSQLEESR